MGDVSFRRRMVHVSHLLVGNYSGALLALVAVALTARALGPTDYGILALTIAFARAIERLVSFQSWQPIIKYGAALSAEDDKAELKALLKFGLLLDIGSAILGWMTAILSALVASYWLGWDEETTQLVLLYSTVLLFCITGLPTAVLRLAGRFRVVAYGQVLSAAVRLVLCGAATWMGGDLLVFGLIWMVTQILGSMVFLLTAFRVLRQQGVRGILRTPVKGVTRRFPGIWGFAVSANLSLTLRSSANQLDVLLVGALAGPAGAGLYHIAKQIGKLAQQVGAQVQAVVYPDVARLWAANAVAEFRQAVVQVEALLVGFGLIIFAVAFFAGEPLLRWAAGEEFVGAAPILAVQMIAVMLTLSGSAGYSALLAMGRQKQALSVVFVATAVFHLSALILIPQLGAIGASVAHVLLGLIWVVGVMILFRRALAARENGAAAADPAEVSAAPLA
jgi:O-antigen/teichoic acid export membrane protein